MNILQTRLLVRSIPLWIALALLASLFWLLHTPAQAATLTVCPGSGAYATIQSAVNNAAPGDVISICAGTYAENVNLSLMGAAIGGLPGDLTLQGSGGVTIAPGAGNAVYISTSFGGNLTLSNFVATSPDASPIDLLVDTHDSIEVTGSIQVSGVTAIQSGGPGMRLQAQGAVVVTGSHAISNAGDGFEIATDLAITITNSTAISNSANGFWIADRTFEERCSLTPVHLQGLLAQANGNNGVALGRFDGSLATVVRDSRLLDNEFAGLVHDEPSLCSPEGSLDVENSSASGNGSDGFQVNRALVSEFRRTTASENRAVGIYISPPGGLILAAQADGAESISAIQQGLDHRYTITGSLIQSNSIGVHLDARFLDSSAGAAAPTRFEQNIVCANPTAGMMMFADPIMYTETIEALGNWWGAASGPLHPTNPSGVGDRVRDAATRTATPPNDLDGGAIVFAPWIDRVTITASSGPYQPGAPITVNFRPEDGSSAWRLAGGPGATLGTSPFLVATDNGEVAVNDASGASVSTFLTNDNGEIIATLTPAQPGPATVTLQGPCGLTASIPFTIEQPLTFTKSPALQYVVDGNTATFTMTVANQGVLALTNVAVTDDLAPACSRTLPDLAPGATAVYTCTHAPTISYINVATATATTAPLPAVQQDVTPAAALAALSANASAAVQVVHPGLSVVKSVGLNPDTCAQPGSLLVQPGANLYYCLTLTNTGDVTFTTHTIDDALLGIQGAAINAVLPPSATLAITRSVLPALGPVVAEATIMNTVLITASGALGGGTAPAVQVNASGAGAVTAEIPPTNLPPEDEPLLGERRIYLPTIQR